jgi:N-methylhydantoinase B
MAGGGGARIHADGVNTGGLAGSPKISIANVENYEQHYPILYLYRREMADSAGAGTYRGGYGIERAYVVHGADSIPEAVLHCTGYRTPVTTGLGGGHPSATNRFEIKRGTDIITRLAGGELPQSFEALPGNLEVPASMEKTFFGRGDVYRSSSNCGGGTGDPLLREPASVLADIERGLISAPTARTLYGVRLDRDGTSIDETATADERAQALRRRCEMANAPERQCPPVALREVVGWYDYHFRVATGEDGNTYLYRDGESAQPLCPADADPTDYLAWADLSLQAAGPSVDPHYLGEGEFFLRAWYCPHTWRQVDLCVLRYEPAPPNDDHEEHSAESAPALEAAPR